MAINDLNIQRCLILSSNAQIKVSAIKCLKAFNVKEVNVVASNEQFIEKVEDDPLLVILDWEIGEEICLKALEGLKKKEIIGLIPILVLGSEMHAKMISAGYEYSVSKVVIGEKSVENIQQGITDSFKYEETISPIRKILEQIKSAKRAGNDDEAFGVISSAYEDLKSIDRIAIEYAEALIDRDNWDKAGEILKPFAEKQPPNLRAQYSYARYLMRQGEASEAKNLLQKINLLNPANVGCLVQMGNVLIAEGELNEARTAFDEALDVDPDAAEAKQGIGKIELIEGNIDDAMSILRDISTPKELASIFNLSAIHNIKDKSFESAMKLYKYSIELLKSDTKLQAKLYFNAGLGFRKWNKLKEAMICFDKSIELDPEFEKSKRNAEALKDIVKDVFEDETIKKSTALHNEFVSQQNMNSDEGKTSKDPFEVLGGMDSFESDLADAD